MYARRKDSCGGWLSITASEAERGSRHIVRRIRSVARELESSVARKKKPDYTRASQRRKLKDEVGASCGKLEVSSEKLEAWVARKGKQFEHIMKSGRTRMMGALPVRLGGRFRGYSTGKGGDLRQRQTRRLMTKRCEDG